MNFYQDLVEKYLIPETVGFSLIAARLKTGQTPLEIRDQLMEETGGSKLKTGKLVNDVIRSIKIAKVNMLPGALWLILAAYLLLSQGIGAASVLTAVTGVAQFSAGKKVWALYRSVVLPVAV